MMHGRGKSDEAIVAMKPANEAEQSAEEAVERRAEAKGNADQRSTSRTQSRNWRVTVAGVHTESSNARRHSPEVGAVCGKPARTVLCGGRPVMGVPTAIPAVYETIGVTSIAFAAPAGTRVLGLPQHASRLQASSDRHRARAW